MRGERSLSVVACCALAILIAGCGGGEESVQIGTASQGAATAPQTEPAQTQPKRARWDVNDPNIDVHTGRRLAPNPWREPTQESIKPHPHAHVTHLIVRDIKQGRGRARVRPNDYVFMDFIVATYKTGRMFNRAWKHNKPYGTAGTILAWPDLHGLVTGMRGMRAGGRRQIIVPARLSGGIEIDHPDYHRTTYWDVVLRGFYARGCARDGEPCRSGP